MRIANPIYDVAFKYLLEDLEIARLLIAEIIGEEITEISVRSQEMTLKIESHDLLIVRLDFKATIKTKEGDSKKVLIELQKAKMYDDLMRFRRYLGENYKRKDKIKDDFGEVTEVSLPIITIYFLGFPLPGIETSVLKINRIYWDAIHEKELEVKTEFIEKLTHDSIAIIIPELPPKQRNKLEGVLKVFNQMYQLDSDKRLLEIPNDELNEDKLTEMLTLRLRKAATNEDVLNRMEAEEEIEKVLDNHVRAQLQLKSILDKQREELKLKGQELQSKEEELKLKGQEIQSKDEELEAKERALQSKDEQLEAMQKMIEELKKQGK